MNEVEREFQIGMGRVDFLLKGSGSRTMPVEAKRPSQNLQDHERQILLYAFEEGMSFAALTIASQWWLYRAMACGNWRTRKFCEIDLLNDEVRSSTDKLDQELKESGIEMISPHLKNRKKPRTQDQRRLRRYERRWLVERFFAWIQWQRRLLVRWEYYAENFLGFVQLATNGILLKKFWDGF